MMGECMDDSNTLISTHPRHYISLEFCCENTSPSQRIICLGFWQMIDQQPELSPFMATGWSDKEHEPVKSVKVPEIIPRTPCDNFNEVMSHWVELPQHLSQRRAAKSGCVENIEDKEEIPRKLFTDLDNFDATVQPITTIPPRFNTKKDCDLNQFRLLPV